MNQSELDRLNNRFISHEARSLYIFEIGRNADTSMSYTVDYNRLTESLTVLNSDGKPNFIPSPEQITEYIRELISIKLIRLAPGTVKKYDDYHGLTLILSAADTSSSRAAPGMNSGEQTSMHAGWLPSEDFKTLARMGMLIDACYTESELSDFRTYWMVRPDVRLTASQWDQRFVSYLKRQHFIESDRVTVYRERVGLQRK